MGASPHTARPRRPAKPTPLSHREVERLFEAARLVKDGTAFQAIIYVRRDEIHARPVASLLPDEDGYETNWM